ncbi:MAG: HAMP domain-containing sensor histidine kinase [Candidatus Paceibacterota bacterium]|jgi:signal transduction histidine kinase
MKLGTKINLVLVAVVAVALTGAFWVIISIEGANLKQQTVNDATTLTNVLRIDIERMFNQTTTQDGSLVSAAITTDDIIVLQKIADSISDSNLINHLDIFNSQLEIIADTGGKKDEFTNDTPEYKQLREDVLAGKKPVGDAERVYDGVPIIMRVVPVTLRDEKTGTAKNIGLIEVHIPQSSYGTLINALKLRMLAVGIVFTALLVVVLAIILERNVVGPLRRYSVVARKISSGDLDQRVEHSSNDEIGEFGAVFNTMVANLHELDKMKSDFISVAAHQLRTPLAGVRWVLKLLLDGDLGSISEEQKGMVERGYENSDRMSQLVDELLNVSRIENGKFGYKLEKNDFMKLLDTLMENTVLQSKERNVKVILENHVGTIADFSFDAEKLLTAIQNVVDNAMKYTLPGGSVTITIDKNGDYVEVKVSDTGVGIPKDEIPKLFSKFFRAANVIHLQTEGSGLGLFIVKSIILRHGGQIWVESEEGKGTTITIKIPVLDELLPKDESVLV